MQEEWKPVVGYEGLYEVSNLGRVKSLPRNGTKKNGTILSGANNGYGYLKILLCNKKKVTKYIHIIVAEAFLDYKSNKGVIVVDHIDNNKLNNKLNNLRIISHKENITRGNRSNTKTPNIYKIRNKYRLVINNKHIAYFNSLEEAVIERDYKLKNIKNEQQY